MRYPTATCRRLYLWKSTASSGGQVEVKGVGGTWKGLTESVNGKAANLTSQVRNNATPEMPKYDATGFYTG